MVPDVGQVISNQSGILPVLERGDPLIQQGKVGKFTSFAIGTKMFQWGLRKTIFDGVKMLQFMRAKN